jgi:hypothetical protein
VPGEEVSGSMDRQGVLHMNGHKVIVPSLRSWILCGTQLRRRFDDTLDSGNVCFLLRSGDVAPATRKLHLLRAS